VQGINAFLNTQSQLIGLYSTFESRRRVLDRDLGTMQIDSEGLWIDPGPITLETVGGSLGAALRNYGLTPEEVLRADTEELECPPIEVVPSDRIPMTEDGDPGIINDAAPMAPLDNGARRKTSASPFRTVGFVSGATNQRGSAQPSVTSATAGSGAANTFRGHNDSGTESTHTGTFRGTTTLDRMNLPSVPQTQNFVTPGAPQSTATADPGNTQSQTPVNRYR
jgi:hypothetical protein